MAFTVEDGTGLADANSGASVAEADDYFMDRANVAWTGEDSVKQAALIRATDYVELRFATRFAGQPQFPDVPQALSFPRMITNPSQDPSADALVSTGVPVAYKRAIFEYAVRALVGPLAPDPVVSSSGLAVIAEGHKVGPVDDTYRYANKGQGSTPMLFRPYPAADALLRPLVVVSQGLIR